MVETLNLSRCTSKSSPWMHPRRNAMRMYAVHNEQDVISPNGAEILGQTDTYPIPSFWIGNHVFITQHHLEIPVKFMTSVVDRMALDLDTEIIVLACNNCLTGDRAF